MSASDAKGDSLAAVLREDTVHGLAKLSSDTYTPPARQALAQAISRYGAIVIETAKKISDHDNAECVLAKHVRLAEERAKIRYVGTWDGLLGTVAGIIVGVPLPLVFTGTRGLSGAQLIGCGLCLGTGLLLIGWLVARLVVNREHR